MKQYIGISRDHSGSMFSLKAAAQRDYNDNVDEIKHAALGHKIDTIVTTVECGGNVRRSIVNSNVQMLATLASYRTDGQTPLFDSVGELIELLSAVPDSDDPSVSFLVMAITDGEENASTKYNARKLAAEIKRLQATDRWTFVFRVPAGYGRALVNLGVPEGNIQEWEQTERGIRESSEVTRKALNNYYIQRSTGVRSTDSFYTDLSHVSKAQIKAVLSDISHIVRIWPVRGSDQIRPFVERKLGHEMRLGCAFYQLSKPEKVVQSHKMLVIRDKNTGAVYGGPAARDLLNLPHTGTIRLYPGQHGDYEVYVQSTSTNRKLMPGTNVLYWDTF